MTNINLTNENEVREPSKEDDSPSKKMRRDNLNPDQWDIIKDTVAENVSALKELVLTPPRATMTLLQVDSTGGKRSRCLFETPSPGGSGAGPASKTPRALGSPPLLKRTVSRDSPKGPKTFDIAVHFPALEVEELRDEVRVDGRLPFPRRRLRMKPLNKRTELAFMMP